MSIQRRRFLLASFFTGALVACGRKLKTVAVPAGASVLALGDSITFGTGATAQTSYPAELATLTGWRVVNAGVPGDTSAGALARMPALLRQHSPQLVLVSIGGNDFLRRLSPAQTRANIRSICQLATAAGAQVLLVGVPEASVLAALSLSLSDHRMYEEVSTELKLPLHAGGWAAVLGDPALRSDPIHANARGYAQFARGLAQTARDVGLWAPR
jgi:lysophospholipase L1-like esterase